jgi:hypothetical protein
MRCPACGVEVVQEAVYCHKCGERLLPAENGPPPAAGPTEQPAAGPADAFGQAAAARRETLGEPEREIWRGGYSSKAMAAGWAISALVDVALLVVGIYFKFESKGWLILLLLMFLPWLYYFAVLCYRRMSVGYVLTTQRFMHEHGILRRINGRIELLDIDDITLEQGLWERLVGVGTIRIVSHDRTDPELALPGIENVGEVTTLFDNARLAERRRRGLHVEQI